LKQKLSGIYKTVMYCAQSVYIAEPVRLGPLHCFSFNFLTAFPVMSEKQVFSLTFQ